MRRSIRIITNLLAAMFYCGAVPLMADTIKIRTPGGAERVCVDEVIVMTVTANSAAYIFSDDGIKDYGNCSAEGKERLLVTKSSPKERRELIERWKRLGHTAVITTIRGTKFTVFNLAYDIRDIVPWSWGFRPRKTGIQLQNSTVNFSDIQTMAVKGDAITLILINGNRTSDKIYNYFVVVGNRKQWFVPAFGGIRELNGSNIEDFSIRLRDVKSVYFKR